MPAEKSEGPKLLGLANYHSVEVGGLQVTVSVTSMDLCQMLPWWVGKRSPSPNLLVTFSSGDHPRPGLHNSWLHSWRQGLAASSIWDSALCPAASQSCLQREFDTKSTNISLHKAHFISLSRTSKRAKLGGLPNRLYSLRLLQCKCCWLPFTY